MTDAALVAAATTSAASIAVLIDVVIVLAACVVFGLVAQRLGQSVLVGYLLAGVVVGGPTSLDLIDDIESFSFMGELGIALLLFTVGLDLPFHKVRRMGGKAVVAGVLQVSLTTLAAFLVAHAVGVGASTALVLGFAVSLSSTAVVIRVLADRSETDSVHGLVSTGMLIVQDVIVVLVLLVIPLLPGADAGGDQGSFAFELGRALLSLLGLLIATVAIEYVVLRRMFQNTRFDGARELLAVSSITVSLGAIGACWALGLSPALGGFIAGIVMADAPYAAQVRAEISPIRMGLIAIFFAYVGMLADAGWMLQHAPLVLLVVVVLVLGKAVITWAAARVARVPIAASVMTGAALCQLGEFSFVVLTTGVGVGLVGDEQFRLLVAVSLMTLLATPFVIGATSRLLHRHSLASVTGIDLEGDQVEQAMAGHAVVVGVGPAGRAVAAAFAAARVPVTVVELNPRTDPGRPDQTLPMGTRVVFGDAARAEILARANVKTARILVVTIPDPQAIRTIIEQARQVAPDVPIVARGRYNRYVPQIAAAGADDVVDEEQLTGTELADVSIKRFLLAGGVERRRGDRRRAGEEEAD